MHATPRLILSASVRFSNDRNLINLAIEFLSYFVCIGVISIIYFTLCKIKKKFVSKTYIKVLVTFDAEVMVAPLAAAADVNPSIESWKLHLSLLQKHSSTLWVLYMSSSFWLLGVESRDFSQAEKERTAWKVEQIHKMTTIFTQNDNLGPFWVKMIVILWICLALQAVLSFLAWDKSHDSTANWRKLEDM